MNRILPILIFCLFFQLGAIAQELTSLEEKMVEYQNVIGSSELDSERLDAARELRETWISAFALDSTFDYSFSRLDKVGVLMSPDKEFKLINYNVPMRDGSYRYYAFVLFPNGKYTELLDRAELSDSDSDRTYTNEDWYGALYYHIQLVKHKRDVYYTLIGWDGNSALSNKKVLDVIEIGKRGKITFGKPIFAVENGYAHRRIFEYAKNAQMTLTYLSVKAAIVFDVLEPRLSGAEGNPAYYGPGTSHNAYRLEDGKWILQENIDMSRPKSEEGKAQFNFPDRPDLDRIRKKSNPLIGE